MYGFGMAILEDKLAETAGNPETAEEEALIAVTALGSSLEPNPELLSYVVINGRRNVAIVALETIYQRFGKQVEVLASILKNLKIEIDSRHHNFELIKDL